MSRRITVPSNEIIYLYSVKGYSAVEIGKIYNVSNCTIGNILRRYNIPYNIIPRNFAARHNPNSAHKIIFSDEDVNEIIRLYTQEHMTSPEIGKLFGVRFPKIIKVLKENNTPIVDSRHDRERRKLINTIKIPDLFKNISYLNHHLTGEVTCPTCHKTRRLLIGTVSRMSDIIKSEGRCGPCAQMKRAMSLDFSKVLYLYEHDKLTPKQIGNKFSVSDMTVRKLLKLHNTKLRKRGELHTRKPISKGTPEHPQIGDIRRGTEIGFRHKSFYKYVECSRCKGKRWQEETKTKKHSTLCLECSTTLEINNKGTLEYPELGDIRKGIEIGKISKWKYADYYIWVECQECHKRRWQLKIHSSDHPLCTKCAPRINGLNHRGANNKLWRGGFKPYPYEFNDSLRERIRERDKHTCQLCGKSQNGRKLAIHHIDYNKRHTHPKNLISLCPTKKGEVGCHAKTNNNREYWITYFQNFLSAKFPEYDYSIPIPDDNNLRGYKPKKIKQYCPESCPQYPNPKTKTLGNFSHTCYTDGLLHSLKREHSHGYPFIRRPDCPYCVSTPDKTPTQTESSVKSNNRVLVLTSA